MVFMTALLIQLAVSLFLPGRAGGESGNIDVVVRTTAAAVFGYILSANFNCRASAAGSGTVGGQATELSSPASHEGPLAQIGFQAPVDGSDTQLQRSGPAASQVQDDPDQTSRLQIIAATVIGLFCLLALMLVRWLGLPGDSGATATVAQFRDFVSGCVGFLIGCPTHNSNSSQT